MYNLAWDTRDEVMARLRERRAAFDAICDMNAPLTLLAYHDERRKAERHAPVSPMLRVCHFLGILDSATERIGCMVHPSLHGGVDGRDCGAYDRHTCAAFKCQAYRTLKPIEAELIIRACLGDSLRYGWVLNDSVYLQVLFEHLVAQGGPIRPAWLDNETLVTAIAAYLDLKVHWPYRDPNAPIAGILLPEAVDDLPWRVEYDALGVVASRWDRVLRALGSAFDDVDELEDAEAWLDEVFEAITQAVRGRSNRSSRGQGG